jgi:mannose-1-phosphate guanylyltransferase
MLHAVIMAGGSGTRFWPASRRHLPKQLLALATETPLLRMTFERLGDLVPVNRVWVVTTVETAQATRTVLPELPPGNILSEPMGRNTAACAGLAARAIQRVDPEAVCIVLPADHVIGEEEQFRAAMAAGAEFVSREGGLLTFGVRPTRPETGYGYLELGPEHSRRDKWSIHRLRQFVEKPDIEHARTYLDSGGYLWNAGIFAWRATTLLDEIRRQIPDLASGLNRIGAALGTAESDAVLSEVYPSLPATSLDFGIMEGAEQLWTLPVDFPWSDVGSWTALAEGLSGDATGNATRGRVQAIDAGNNVLVSTGPVLSVVGVDNLVVVATPDAVLVVPKDQAQRVREVVEGLREKGWDDVL